jgi:hypothetical protein
MTLSTLILIFLFYYWKKQLIMNFEEIFKETETLFNGVVESTAIPRFVKFKLVGCPDQKEIYKLSKTNPLVKYLTGIDILVTLNEDIFSQLNDEQQKVILQECVAQVYYDMDNDKLKLIKPDVNTFSRILEQFGVKEYMELKEVISAIQNQKEEK